MYVQPESMTNFYFTHSLQTTRTEAILLRQLFSHENSIVILMFRGGSFLLAVVTAIGRGTVQWVRVNAQLSMCTDVYMYVSFLGNNK